MKRTRIGLFTLITLAILSAAISPACAFISGNGGSWIEICSGMNVIKIKTNTQSEIPDMTQGGCEFCFHTSHIIAITTAAFVIVPPIFHDFKNGFITEYALIQFYKTNHSRAPPVFS